MEGVPFKDKETKVYDLMDDPVVVEIAKIHGKAPSQILLRHQVQAGIIVIPKSTSKERIAKNFDLFDFSLSNDEMAKLDALDRGSKGRTFDFDFVDFDVPVKDLVGYPCVGRDIY